MKRSSPAAESKTTVHQLHNLLTGGISIIIFGLIRISDVKKLK